MQSVVDGLQVHMIWYKGYVDPHIIRMKSNLAMSVVVRCTDLVWLATTTAMILRSI